MSKTGTLSDKDICRLCGDISDCGPLAIQLGFKYVQVEKLRCQYHFSVDNQIQAMLFSWRDTVQRCGDNPRLLLAKAFLAVDNPRLAETITPDIEDVKTCTMKSSTECAIQNIRFGVECVSVPNHKTATANTAKSFDPSQGIVPYFQETTISKQIMIHMATGRPLVLFGTHGAGKSQNAMWFAKIFQKDNPRSFVGRINAQTSNSFLSSLQTVARMLDIQESDYLEHIDKKQYLSCLTSIIADCLKNRHGNEINLLVIDDVDRRLDGDEVTNGNDICIEATENLLASSTDNKNLRFIVTTNNGLLFQEHTVLEVRGFTQEETVHFFRELRHFQTQTNEDILQLAEYLSYLPLGMETARRYMSNTRTSVSKYLQLLHSKTTADEVRRKETQYLRGYYDKHLLVAQQFAINKLMESKQKHVSEMFTVLQFFETEHIPVSLLQYFLPDDVDTATRELHLNDLVEAVQEYSFGAVDGVDSDRFLSLHSVISEALKQCTSNDDQTSLLRKTLVVLVSYLDKDTRACSDCRRNIHLLTHCTKVLKIAEKLLSRNLEDILVQVMLCDIVGHTYALQGLNDLGEHYLLIAKRLCYEMADLTVETVDKRLQEEGVSRDANTIAGPDDHVCQRKAVLIAGALLEKSEYVSDAFVKQFVRRKVRNKEQLELLATSVQDKCIACFTDLGTGMLSEELYSVLLEKGLIAPIHILKKTFLIEVTMSVLYTLGRQYYYNCQFEMLGKTDSMIEDLFLSYLVGKEVAKITEFMPVHCLLSETQGIIQHVIERRPCDGCQDIEQYKRKLLKAVNSFECKISTEQELFEFGVLKSRTSDIFNQSLYLERLMRMYQYLMEYSTDKNEKELYRRKACDQSEKLLSRITELENFNIRPVLYCYVAEFYMATGSTQDRELAFQFFQKGFEIGENDETPPTVSKSERCLLGMLQCLNQQENYSHAKLLANKLMQNLNVDMPRHRLMMDQITCLLKEIEENEK